jgi:putative FmdB family regulatory protein
MPSYVFRCDECDRTVEMRLPMEHEPPVCYTCETPGLSRQMRRVFSAPNVPASGTYSFNAKR